MNSARGFTIIELIVVIVVIAILATITTVVYSGIQNRAYDAAVQSDLRNLAQKIDISTVDTGNDMLACQSVAYDGSEAVDSCMEGLGVFDTITKSVYADREDAFIFLVNGAPNQRFAGISKSGKAFVYMNGSVRETEVWHTDTSPRAANALGIAGQCGPYAYWSPSVSSRNLQLGWPSC